MGSSKIFDDRYEKAVEYEIPELKVPTKPDRVCGLKATDNIRRLLAKPLPPNSWERQEGPKPIGSVIRTSVFRWEDDPLLFPFLILEAKKDSVEGSWRAIEAQTVFPIWLALNLQRGLQSYRTGDHGLPDPFVWFIGYKGCEWRVYGCYSGAEEAPKPAYVSSIVFNVGGKVLTSSYAVHASNVGGKCVNKRRGSTAWPNP